jgi:hypothetical protein
VRLTEFMAQDVRKAARRRDDLNHGSTPARHAFCTTTLSALVGLAQVFHAYSADLRRRVDGECTESPSHEARRLLSSSVSLYCAASWIAVCQD